jgi:hypothetical protein
MVRRRRFLLGLLAAGATPSVLAQAHGHAGHMAGNELGASAAFDREGVLWTVDRENGRVCARSSRDFGRVWSAPVPVTSERLDSGGDARPKIAVAAQGDIYVTWTRPMSKPYTGEIRFSRSTDGGRSFGAPLIVHHDRREITHRFDALTVNSAGQIFVAWVDKRDQLAAGRPDEYRGAAIYFAVSDDGGRTFRGDFRAAEHTCECCRIALLPRSDGSVLALWRHVFAPNIRDHALARLTPDGTAHGFRRATFDDWHVDACPHHGPSLAADSAGELHAVWYSGAAQRNGAFYGRIGGDGVAGQRRLGGDTAEHPDLAIAGQRIAVAWKEFDGQRSLLKAIRSDDGGRTWTERQLAATAGASDQPRVLAAGQKFFVFWNTRLEPRKVMALV